MLGWLTIGRIVALGLALLAAPVAAQEKPTAASDGETYRHAGSQMGAPAELAGFTRREVSDPGGTGRDVGIQYRTPDEATFLTVYFYRSPYPGPALWFEQARRALEINPVLGGRALADAVRTFATRVGMSEDAFLVAYRLRQGTYRSTALATASAGRWIVKLRMTSSSLDASEIEERMIAAARALEWPGENPDTARTILPCGNHLSPSRRAREAEADEALRGDALRRLTTSAHETAVRPLCFDRQEQPLLGVYQEEGEADGYLLALGDNGRLARVRAVRPGEQADLFVVEFYDLDAAYVAAFFRGMPSPAQVLAAADELLRTRNGVRVEYLKTEVRPDAGGAVPVT